MSVIKAKPTSPGRRFVVSIKRDLYKGKPYKPLTEKKSKNGGRNILAESLLDIKVEVINTIIESLILKDLKLVLLEQLKE